MMAGAKRGGGLPKALFVLILAVVAAAIIYSGLQGSSRDWPVPEVAKQLKNPVQENAASLKEARDIYSDKCDHCHGDSGKGDGVDAGRYDPAPTDFTDAKRMNGTTDGELFYKISEGKKPMPVFKAKLTEGQRWELVLLIRSFARPSPQDTPAR